jgi:hypothetical protein
VTAGGDNPDAFEDLINGYALRDGGLAPVTISASSSACVLRQFPSQDLGRVRGL